MATEEVKIFFKVDGLDGYITDLGDLKSALGQVDSETKEVTQATEQLSQAQIQSSEGMEQGIMALEGSVKLLAGSAEFAAGAIGLLGEENSEFFEEVEGNVLNIIALAQGAIDMSEGFRILSQNQKLATIAQRIFNTVSKANPYVLLATAILAVGAAVLAYYTFMKDDAIPTEEQLQEIQEKNQRIVEANIASTKEAEAAEKSRVDSLEDLRQKINDVNNAEDQRNQTTLDGAIATTEAIKVEQEKAISLTDAYIAAVALNVGSTFSELQSLIDQNLNLTEEEQRLYDLYVQKQTQEDSLLETADLLNAAYARRNEILRQQYFVEGEVIEQREVGLIPQEEIVKELVVGTTAAITATTENVVGMTAAQTDAITNVTDAAEYKLEGLQQFSTQAFSFLSDVSTLFNSDEEERNRKAFEINKKAQLAGAIISGALAVNKAFASQILPGDPTSIVRAIAAAAVAGVAAAAQIATISRQTFESPSPGGGGGGTATLNYQVGGQEAGPEVGLSNESMGGGGLPTQTYVLAGDVTSAQNASAQIENLARL